MHVRGSKHTLFVGKEEVRIDQRFVKFCLVVGKMSEGPLRCNVCSKTVFIVELQKFEDKPYHKVSSIMNC